MNPDKLVELAARKSGLPRTYEELFKRTLDARGRPVKSLQLPCLRAHAQGSKT